MTTSDHDLPHLPLPAPRPAPPGGADRLGGGAALPRRVAPCLRQGPSGQVTRREADGRPRPIETTHTLPRSWGQPSTCPGMPLC